MAYPLRDEAMFNRDTYRDLKKRLVSADNKIGYSEAYHGLRKMMSNTRQQTAVDECKGILMLSKRMSYDLRWVFKAEKY
jgi:ERCC4-type nuclease